ncbi:hypothetical protein [Escherichia coli]|uniref:hypothetical protein n=1 Tax=Escherichia coli TaxID=562 RepID=UPI002B24CEBC|nr:hypothetical protein [Escherichia coli]
MNVNEQQTVDNYEIDICEFEEVKDIDPVSKRKTLGCCLLYTSDAGDDTPRGGASCPRIGKEIAQLDA